MPSHCLSYRCCGRLCCYVTDSSILQTVVLHLSHFQGACPSSTASPPHHSGHVFSITASDLRSSTAGAISPVSFLPVCLPLIWGQWLLAVFTYHQFPPTWPGAYLQSFWLCSSPLISPPHAVLIPAQVTAWMLRLLLLLIILFCIFGSVFCTPIPGE